VSARIGVNYLTEQVPLVVSARQANLMPLAHIRVPCVEDYDKQPIHSCNLIGLHTVVICKNL
jgi:hypothetical protein